MRNPVEPSVLRKEIREKQNEISDYLSDLEPRGARLTYVSIVCGALAVLLNTQTVLALSQSPGSSASWLVPLVAAGLSTAATIAAGVHKTQVESRLPKFQRCAAGMEGLAVLLDARQLSEAAAAKEFRKYIEDCPAIPRRRNFVFEAVRGTIDEPGEGQTLQADFVASGTVRDAGNDARIWLAVEIDGRIWPKEGRIVVRDAEGHWSQPVFEDGTSAEFALSLWAANAEADRSLRAWLDASNRTRVFSELRPLAGMRRLDRVGKLRRQG
jgi:hypothetical protein